MANETFKKQVVIDWTLKIASFIMSIAIMISSFFLTKAWDKISNIETKVAKLELDYGVHSTSQFTYKQWVEAKTNLDNERNAMDRRLIRIEETYPTINNAIIEIKQSIRRMEDQSLK